MIVSASGMVSGFIPRPYQNIFTCANNNDAEYKIDVLGNFDLSDLIREGLL